MYGSTPPGPVASIIWLGALSEWPTLTPPLPASVPRLKHTSWYMSDHYICLQYLLFLSLIFRLCWLCEIENLFGISFAENLPNNCFRFSFSPTKSLATSTRVRASVLSLWTCNIMRWFSLESPVVERKYVFTRFKAENDLSQTALVKFRNCHWCISIHFASDYFDA